MKKVYYREYQSRVFFKAFFIAFQDGSFPTSLPSNPKGPILHISNVQKDHAGTYICTASNGVGSISADEIELKVYCESNTKQ